jgi:glycosyltransferase involved in cell wall biosynthesis
VILAGFRRDVLSLHKAFDVFVMSSVTEGLGTSVLDAMASGKPVVATNTGGIPEVVVDGETGFLVTPRDHRAMADAIVRLLADASLRQRMGAAGSARVRETFSADVMVRKTADVYARVFAD